MKCRPTIPLPPLNWWVSIPCIWLRCTILPLYSSFIYLVSIRDKCKSLDLPAPQGSIRYLDARTIPLTVSGMTIASGCSTDVSTIEQAPFLRSVRQHRRTQYSSPGSDSVLLRTYWNTSQQASTCATILAVCRSGSQRCLSLSRRRRTSSGGASTSEQTLHKRRG